MKFRNLIGTFVTVVLVTSSVLAADTYNLDPNHTDVAFSIEHLVINTVQGRFKDVSGSVTLDDKNFVTAASATIQTKSIDTGIEKRDNHLRSADFFDAEKCPTLTFEGKKVVEQGGEKALVGTLTMHGVSKEVSLSFTIKGPVKDPLGRGASVIGIRAHTKLNRKDFGLKWNKLLETGGLAVGEEVDITINAEAVKK
jgi:polyisoprenoid-binding protein YceI